MSLLTVKGISKNFGTLSLSKRKVENAIEKMASTSSAIKGRGVFRDAISN